MSTPARRRLMRDFRRLQNDPPSGVTGAPMDNNILAWQVGFVFGWLFFLVSRLSKRQIRVFPSHQPAICVLRGRYLSMFGQGQDVRVYVWAGLYRSMIRGSRGLTHNGTKMRNTPFPANTESEVPAVCTFSSTSPQCALWAYTSTCLW